MGPYPTAIACWMADVKRMDLHYAVRTGYPPTAEEGEFDTVDLVGLHVFGALRKAGYTVGAASLTVVDLVNTLRVSPTAETVRVNWTADGDRIETFGPTTNGRRDSALETMIDIRVFRRQVEQREIEWANLETANGVR